MISKKYILLLLLLILLITSITTVNSTNITNNTQLKNNHEINNTQHDTTQINTKTMKNTNKEYVNIITGKLVTQVNKTSNITLQITSQYKRPVNTGQVTYTINNNTKITNNVKKGITILQYKFNKTQPYNITAIYHDNTDNYYDGIQQFQVNIIDPRPTINMIITPTNTTTQTTTTITINYQDTYKNHIENGTTQIKIDKKELNTQIEHGQTILKYQFNKTGNHIIQVTYHGNTQYKTSTITKTIQVTKQTTKTIITKVNPVKDTTTTLHAIIKDQYGNKINNGTATYYINGVKETTKTVKNGEVKYNKTFDTARLRNLTIRYNGDNNHQASVDKITLHIQKINTTTKITRTNPVKDTTTTLHAIIIDYNGKLVSSGTVTCYINGKKTITKNITNGKIQYNTQFTKAQPTNLTIRYNGNTQYNPSVNKITLYIQKINTTTTLKQIKPVKGNNITLNMTIKDANNKKVSNGTVTIYIHGKKVATKTVKNGQVQCPIIFPTAGQKNLTIRYNGDTQYKPSIITMSLTIQKATTKITNTKITKKNNKTIINAIINDNHGKQVTLNTAITIKVNNKIVISNKYVVNGKINMVINRIYPRNTSYLIKTLENSQYKSTTVSIKT
ncbi:Ig-like domain-containing protein [Methanosphaera sp. WGK6]|uniref:Ig-like domain-containing protein n=1 Tax=Methanosphaera sp. WGK6 TaxID=1561964 RepID=UPI00084C7473|nr:Ig-like domain-containing protein [Methanosphaera sp. WGK6]OED29920.1 hypothetical protein NL43_05800 [Methanosphaera sp. WGK6]